MAFLNHYTLDECIPRTGDSYTTLIRALKSGNLKAQKVSSVWLIHENDLDDYIRKRSKRTDEQPNKGAASETGDRPSSFELAEHVLRHFWPDIVPEAFERHRPTVANIITEFRMVNGPEPLTSESFMRFACRESTGQIQRWFRMALHEHQQS